MHLSQLRSQVKWSSLLTCSRYWTATSPPHHPPPPLPAFTINDTANSLTTEDDKSKPSLIWKLSGRPAHMHCFPEHQLHMLGLLCLKWANAKIPLCFWLGTNVCKAPMITAEDNQSVCSLCLITVVELWRTAETHLLQAPVGWMINVFI